MTDHTVYIGLGSNLGNREVNLTAAIAELQEHPQIQSVRTSSFYQTKPLGKIEQSTFLNAVAETKTTLEHRALFETLQRIEQAGGRQRNEHWGPRTIDLDLLLYDDAVIDEPDLIIPHPQMHLRNFVLKGLFQLHPELIHPVLKRSMRELKDRLNGSDYWLDAKRPQLLSIAGNVGVGKSTLAAALAERLGATFIPEKYDDNPFLPQVYAGRKDLALDSELFFLNSRAVQLRDDRLSAPHRYISDYVFDQAFIFASSWLDQKDLTVYHQHYASAREAIVPPMLVIYLRDSIEKCLGRIHKRNRPYEQQIEKAFLEHLARGYDTLYNDFTICPVMRISPEECWTADQVDRIAEEVQCYIV